MNSEKSLRICKQQRQGCLQTHSLLSCTFLRYVRLSIHVTTCSISHGNTSQCMERDLGERSRVMQESQARATALTFPLLYPPDHELWHFQKPVSKSVPNPHLTQSSCNMKQGRGKKKNTALGQLNIIPAHTWGLWDYISLHAAAGRSSAKSVWESGTQVLKALTSNSHHTSLPESGDHSSSSRLRCHETFKHGLGF